MDDNDDGTFTYDINMPPLCLREAKNQMSEKNIHKLINTYYLNGDPVLLPHTAMLEPGFTAGEAALLHLRGVAPPKHKEESPKTAFIIQQIEKLARRRKKKIPSSRIRDVVLTWFSTDKDSRFSSLKKIMSMIHLKHKGYTHYVRHMLDELDRQCL